MANGLALLTLAQDVHWLDEAGTPHQIQGMQDDDCHAALDIIDLQTEEALERELAEALARMLASQASTADMAAAMILLNLICDHGPGWVKSTPLVTALLDRSVANLFVTASR